MHESDTILFISVIDIKNTHTAGKLITGSRREEKWITRKGCLCANSKAASTHEVEKASSENEENGFKERENLESDVVEEGNWQRGKPLPLECSTQVLPPQWLSLEPLREPWSLLFNHVPD